MEYTDKKRKWKPYVNKDGKWITGYAAGSRLMEEGDVHEIRELKLKPTTFGRGRSSVTFEFADKDGWEYSMSTSAAAAMFRGLSTGAVIIRDGWFVGNFIQIKQGSQLSIIVYTEES